MAISPVRIAILSVAVAFAALARDFRVPAGCAGEEIQRAIDDAFSAGGGRVVVTPGDNKKISIVRHGLMIIFQ